MAAILYLGAARLPATSRPRGVSSAAMADSHPDPPPGGEGATTQPLARRSEARPLGACAGRREVSSPTPASLALSSLDPSPAASLGGTFLERRGHRLADQIPPGSGGMQASEIAEVSGHGAIDEDDVLGEADVHGA